MNTTQLNNHYEKFREIKNRSDLCDFFRQCEMAEIADFLEKKLPDVTISDVMFYRSPGNYGLRPEAKFIIGFSENSMELSNWYIGSNPEYTIRSFVDGLIIKWKHNERSYSYDEMKHETHSRS